MSTMPWLKKGAAAAAAIQQHEAQVELAKQEQGKLWRFYLKEGQEAEITFIDGDLDEQGLVDGTYVKEHTIEIAPKDWQNFICTEDTEPCPLCAAGDKPSLVCFLTVVDHRSFAKKDGTTGKDTPKLFAAKPKTVAMLRKMAEKLGGLKGARFNVSRSDSKSAGVGDVFIPLNKLTAEELLALRKTYIVRDKDNNVVKNEKTGKPKCQIPADYEEELTYRTASQLLDMGVGKAVKSIGKEKPLTENTPMANSAAGYDSEL